MSEATLTCFACDREPAHQCARCGRPYCDDHGDELCAICLQPSSGLPSYALYRGSLLALLIGAVLAVWLLVQPSGDESEALRPIVLTPTTLASSNQTQTAGTTTPQTNATPRPTVPAASATPSGQLYTVVANDSLSGICARERPSLNNVECVTQVRTLNGLTSDNLEIGQRIRLP
jgi:hypothetical protein